MAAISSNGLYRTRTLFAVELHPSTVSDVLGGVKEQLNAHLLRYVDEFDGVLVAYSNVQILTKQPVIHPYFPYFHLDVRADVLLFKPSPGMTLVARVNHLGEDYISALALGVFNVTIPSRAVMPELAFLREENKWIHKVTPQHQIHEHSYIVFRVEDVKDNGGFFQISGSMREPATGAADFLHPGVKLPEPPAGWPADPVSSPREDEDGDVVMGGAEAATPSGRGLAALAAATAAAAGNGAKEKHGKEGKDGKGSKREHGADGEAAAKKRRKTDAGGVPVAAPSLGAAAQSRPAAATPAAAATGTTMKKEKEDKSDKKKEKEEKKKDKEAKKKAKEEKKKAKTAAAAPALSAPPQVGAPVATGAAPSTAGPAHTTRAVTNGVVATAAATPQIAAANGTTPAAEASRKKDKKEKKDKSEKKEKKDKSEKKEKKDKSSKKDKKAESG
ncbi:hypothetical protein HYH02_008247 [Chlamydomonas schloesseri]|uniref:RPA43 OB domain-containing protein n=1 Tax=Chlamydomonas schloesseri TaxID=2026947 RepID=A0A836B436_9CHLO|nr:hypothetical protein HYH02_008247 [Chlamydomonas schloesseri]|eukprot:KAG2446679.1 hypothetical protein HYH02_008247 [Chlamydomonas schloesseri]